MYVEREREREREGARERERERVWYAWGFLYSVERPHYGAGNTCIIYLVIVRNLQRTKYED
jgi:hypothetical protein